MGFIEWKLCFNWKKYRKKNKYRNLSVADKDRDVEAMTNRIRNELNEETVKRQSLIDEIQSLKLQLEESKAGLLAAARISDQLEIAQVTNATIKEECKYLGQILMFQSM